MSQEFKRGEREGRGAKTGLVIGLMLCPPLSPRAPR